MTSWSSYYFDILIRGIIIIKKRIFVLLFKIDGWIICSLMMGQLSFGFGQRHHIWFFKATFNTQQFDCFWSERSPIWLSVSTAIALCKFSSARCSCFNMFFSLIPKVSDPLQLLIFYFLIFPFCLLEAFDDNLLNLLVFLLVHHRIFFYFLLQSWDAFLLHISLCFLLQYVFYSVKILWLPLRFWW